jgi:hypothetical protein
MRGHAPRWRRNRARGGPHHSMWSASLIIRVCDCLAGAVTIVVTIIAMVGVIGGAVAMVIVTVALCVAACVGSLLERKQPE